MRKITERVIEAFESDTNFKSGHDEVHVFSTVTILRLFGNIIAWRHKTDFGVDLKVSDGGYKMSNTTKDRLNGLNGVEVKTVAGTHYLNGKKWDGKMVDIDEWNRK